MVGSLLHGRYRVERMLGRGGMALVYEGVDERLDRPVAVKVLADNLAADGESRRRFLREARLAARVSHPAIVAVYDSGETDGRPFIVMELVRGPTLAEELYRRERLPPADAAAIAGRLASALADAHAAGLVHRDVKPGNVLVGEDGAPKITDFGIAKAAGDSTAVTQVGTVLGTAAYLAPEQAEGREAGPEADVYGLGVLLYELLTGRPPYTGATLAELVAQRQSPIPPPSRLEPDVPRWLDALVMRCLARDPGARPTAAEVAGAIDDSLDANAAGSQPVGLPATRVLATAPTRAWRPARVPPRARRAVLALVAIAVLAAVLAAVLLTSGGGSSSPPAPARISAVPHGATPADQARLLARWLRRYSAAR